MRYLEAKCTDAECTMYMPSYCIGSYMVASASESIQEMVAQQADSHAQATGHEVVMQTVFRKV